MSHAWIWIVAASTVAISAAVAQGMPPGYLDASALPDATRFIAPPPAPGTPAFAADRAAHRAARARIGDATWKRAAEELDPSSAAMRAHVSCVIGAALDPATTPVTLRLLERLGTDAERTAGRVKALYKRPRPYTDEPGAQACDPKAKAGMGSTSYPSGYAATGWLWGFALASLAPGRRDDAIAFGASIGDNRVACRVHYPSDVMAGRLVGSAVYAAEIENPAFLADLALARAEVAKARAAGKTPSC